MNRFQRPFFVAKVRELGTALGHPDIFEKWLFSAQVGNLRAMAYLKDFGLLPDTHDELKESIDEYAEFINEFQASRRFKSTRTRK